VGYFPGFEDFPGFPASLLLDLLDPQLNKEEPRNILSYYQDVQKILIDNKKDRG
jgi:hypothetical protein